MAATEVEIDVKLYYSHAPQSCHDDETLSICYGVIASRLKACAQAKPYRLIERLAFLLHAEVKRAVAESCPDDEVRVWLRARKTVLPIDYVHGGASFTVSDLPAATCGLDVE